MGESVRTHAELVAMRKRLQHATPCPWWHDRERALVNSDAYVIARFGAGFETTPQDAANARFIADAPYGVPLLLATVELLAGALVQTATRDHPAVGCPWCTAQGQRVADHSTECPIRRAAALLG
jgi:hypothetical protein